MEVAGHEVNAWLLEADEATAYGLTPLGARQTIRHQEGEMYDAAVKSGVMVAEGQTCGGQTSSAQGKGVGHIVCGEVPRRWGTGSSICSVWHLAPGSPTFSAIRSA